MANELKKTKRTLYLLYIIRMLFSLIVGSLLISVGSMFLISEVYFAFVFGIIISSLGAGLIVFGFTSIYFCNLEMKIASLEESLENTGKIASEIKAALKQTHDK